MGDAKPWQIILIVVAVVGVGFSVWRFGFASQGDRHLLADSIVMIDVNTGELFEFSLRGRRGVMVPASNPQTGLEALLPVFQSETDGGWMVSRRDIDALRDSNIEFRAVDRATGRATPASATPLRVNN